MQINYPGTGRGGGEGEGGGRKKMQLWSVLWWGSVFSNDDDHVREAWNGRRYREGIRSSTSVFFYESVEWSTSCNCQSGTWRMALSCRVYVRILAKCCLMFEFLLGVGEGMDGGFMPLPSAHPCSKILWLRVTCFPTKSAVCYDPNQFTDEQHTNKPDIDEWTDGRTAGWIDGWTDSPCYRVAMTQIKTLYRQRLEDAPTERQINQHGYYKSYVRYYFHILFTETF